MALALLLGVSLGAHGVPNGMPWNDTFEGYAPGTALHGQGGWTASGNNVVVSTNTAYGLSTNSVYIPASAVLTNEFNGNKRTNVWSDMYVKIQRRSSTNAASVDAACSAQFYFNSNGYAVVQSGSATNWIVCTTTTAGFPTTPASTSDWVRVTVYHNYPGRTWALFVDGILVREGIPFINTNLTGYSQFSLGAGETYLDNAWVHMVLPDPTNSSGNAFLTSDMNADSLGDAWTLHYFGRTTNRTSVMATHFDYDGDQYSNFDEYNGRTDPTSSASHPNGYLIPYMEDFELASLGGLSSWHGLTASPSGSMLIQNATVYEGSKSLAVATTGRLDLAISDTAATNVWTDMYIRAARLTSSSAPILPTNTASALYVNENGYLVVYDGGGVKSWVTLTNVYSNGTFLPISVATVDTNTWFRLVLNQDFSASKWSLWRAGNTTNGLATYLATEVNFYTNAVTKYNGFTVSNGLAAVNPYAGYLDKISLTATKPDVIDTDRDGIPDNWEALYTNSIFGLNPSLDLDGDGVNNLNEYISGTDPNNSNEYLRVLAMNLVNSDIQFQINIGTSRNYRVYSADQPAASKTVRGSGTSSFFPQNLSWTDAGAVANCATKHRYYTLAAERGGLVYTNSQEYAMYVQDRKAGLWYMAGVPVDFETTGENSLTNTLGAQMMRGLLQNPEGSADLIWILDGPATNQFVKHWVMTNVWYALSGTAKPTNTTLSAGTGFWVRRVGGFDTNTVFTGKTRTNGTYTVNINTNWNFLTWPFKSERAESAGAGGDDAGWGFLKCGGLGGKSATNSADVIVVLKDNAWRRYRLLDGYGAAVDGRWWDDTRGGYADFTMQAGQGFYYYRRGDTGFTWTNNYGP